MIRSSLLWKTRIGGLKPLWLFLAVVSGLSALTSVANLVLALQNPPEPVATSIIQIVNREVDSNDYISLRGVVQYEAVIDQMETSPITYFYLREQNNLALVRWQAERKPAEGEMLSISGITYRSTSDQRKLISGSLAAMQETGIQINPDIYLNAGEKPPDRESETVKTLSLATVFLLCAVAISLPAMIFQPLAVLQADMAGVAENKTRLTGKLRKLSKAAPPYEFEGGKEKFFENAEAVFERLGEKFIVKHHHYTRRSLFGFITMKIVETDWAVILHGSTISNVENGVVYAWRAYPALRLSYRDAHNNPQTLLLRFKNAATQQACLKAIRE